MGIIAKQSINNTIFSYLGIGIGAAYTLFLIPEIFSQNPDEWGLIQLLFSFVFLFMPFALAGTSNIIIRYWTIYSEKEKGEFAFFLLTLVIVGITVISLLIFGFKEFIFFSENGNNTLMQQYWKWFFPIFFIHTLFYLFISFSRVFYKTSFSTFIRDPFLKFWTAILIIIYWTRIIEYDLFFKLYFSGTVIQLLSLILYLKKNTTLRFTFTFSFFKRKNDIKDLLTYGFFSLLTGGTATLVSRIDLLMISRYINLKEVAYYSIALFFISVLQVPVRSMGNIAVPILSKHLNKQEFKEVKKIYTKFSNNILVTGSFILLAMLYSINEFMQILGPKFGQVKYVIILLGISKLYEIIHFPNSSLIIISKYYKFDILFQIILLIITIISNLIFIPIFGINGAALATAITIIINVSLKELFIYKKYKLHPYNYTILKILFIALIAYFITSFLIVVDNVYIAIILKAFIISIIYFIFIMYFNLSIDLKNIITSSLKHIKDKYIQHKNL